MLESHDQGFKFWRNEGQQGIAQQRKVLRGLGTAQTTGILAPLAGITQVVKVTGLSRRTVARGIKELSVGIDSDTAEFAVESLRRWWREMGSKLYPNAGKLLITADGGGSNGSRVRLWKVALQTFAEETGLTIQVCHYPPGTSKWNKIEHRMFNHISMNWRGRALATRQIIVNLIGQTTTNAGLRIKAALDEGIYPKGRKITDKEMKSLNLISRACPRSDNR